MIWLCVALGYVAIGLIHLYRVNYRTGYRATATSTKQDAWTFFAWPIHMTAMLGHNRGFRKGGHGR